MPRTATLLFALVLALPLAAAPVPKGMKVKRPDAELIVGRWVKESSVNGQTVFNEKGDVWVFAPPGEKSEQLQHGGQVYSLAYSLTDPATRQLDVACNGQPYKGIYELDGDSLKLAFSARLTPTTFDPTPGVYVMTFRRKTDGK